MAKKAAKVVSPKKATNTKKTDAKQTVAKKVLTKTKTVAKAKPVPVAKPKLAAKSKTKPVAVAKPKLIVKSKPKQKPVSALKTKPGAKSKAKLVAATKPKPVSKSKTKKPVAAAKPKPMAKPIAASKLKAKSIPVKPEKIGKKVDSKSALKEKKTVTKNEKKMTKKKEKKLVEIVRFNEPIKKPAHKIKGYSKKDLEHFKKIILEKRNEILEQLQNLKDQMMDPTTGEYINENSPYSLHMAEQGTDAMEREKTFLYAQRENKFLGYLEDSLKRIDTGTYGICIECMDEPQHLCETCPLVPKARLEAVPHSQLCVPIKSRQEKKR